MRCLSPESIGALLLCLSALAAFASQDAPNNASNAKAPPTFAAPSPVAYRQMADSVETNLKEQVLAKWFPAAIDRERGGFYQNFREDWTRDPKNDKGLVYQSRLTWVASQAALRYPALAATYRADALHGLDFLNGSLWDKENGGFFWSLDESGKPERGGEKHAYGTAFGIYASAACYQVTQEARALDLAKRAYSWLDAHAHDKQHGGYYEALTQTGKPILVPSSAASDAPVSDFIGTHYGYKSMNTHIHLLEALTGLYAVWPDAGLRARLQEVFTLVRDKIAVEPGCLNLFFTPDWRPIPDHDSFGHDVETAFLLVEASGALGKPDDPRTWTVARHLVDHALDYGWDKEHGGFYDMGTAFGPAANTDKIWWTQGEGLERAYAHARPLRTRNHALLGRAEPAMAVHHAPSGRPEVRRLVRNREQRRQADTGQREKRPVDGSVPSGPRLDAGISRTARSRLRENGAGGKITARHEKRMKINNAAWFVSHTKNLRFRRDLKSLPNDNCIRVRRTLGRSPPRRVRSLYPSAMRKEINRCKRQPFCRQCLCGQ